ncbi:MAG: hypothetical protein J0M04_17015 [Verrucomicrobia bacterium]|nr:hypothetical protein [Verrucomicrobiota bacterium]
MRTVSSRRQQGFALVVTLTLMVLLTLLAVGLLSLSSVELRKSGNGAAAQARANARLGLILALAEIQEHLGPDQRVSADATVGTHGTPAHPHWLSVWTTTSPDGSPWITRNGEQGGLSDRRQSTGWKARDERIACLVSGNESGIIYQEEQAASGDTMVPLVDQGSLGEDVSPGEIIRAPKVAVADSKKGSGSYAWWVGDLGAKANIATRDRTEADPNEIYHARMLAQDASWQAFAKSDMPDDVRQKLADDAQLALAGGDRKDRKFHDVTVWSAGLPVDVREGGWKRDLTAFIESKGEISGFNRDGVKLPGLKDSDNLVGPANKQADTLSANPGQAGRFSETSPNFGLIRTWAQRASAPAGSFRADSELGQIANRPTGGGNSKSVDFRDRTTTHLMPVLTEGSLYYNLSYYDPAKPVAGNPYAMRVHFYPRVALWNPYNFALKVPESAVFLHINGSKSVEVTLAGGQKQSYRMYWGLGDGATGGSTRGSMFFKLEAATLEPGETLVWSVARNAPYDETNFANNLLSCAQAPAPGRSFYQDKRSDGYPLFQVIQSFPPKPGLANNLLPAVPVEWREMVPPRPAGNIQSTAWTQADDYFMSWKPMSGSYLNDASFRNLPMGRFVSCAYQYGDEDEMPVEWTALDPVPFLKSSLASPSVTAVPDRRTRDGFRLRWFAETESNIIGGGSLAGTPHMESAPVANWNMRASWAYRTPFDNVTDVAPHFFGIYTRDLFDGEVDWSSMNPRSAGGRINGDPFDQPIRGTTSRVLFDVPRRGSEIASLGALQHANFSEFVWHPTYPLGNSLADPRVPLLHTEPDRSEAINKDKGGWNQDSIGYSTDGRSNTNGETNRTHEDNWAWHARNFLQQAALDETLIYDLSYELNHMLWDGYFLSSGTAAGKERLLKDPVGSPLPNGRILPNPLAGRIMTDDLTDYHRAAPCLMIDGAFNVNSASVGAWEALLLSGLGEGHGAEGVAFPRILDPAGGEWTGGRANTKAAWSGQRVFSRAEIRRLAERIVVEVKNRGPFLGMADFVNRRLADDETGRKGALQAAIDRAGLNEAFTGEWPLDNKVSLPDYKHMDHIKDPTRLEQTSLPDTTAWGALGFLTQADLLQFIGPALSARSDTFRIRAYGESLDANGKVAARAWCEAVVQRSPNYVDAADPVLQVPAALNPVNARFGRKFEIVSFRWLRPEEV